MSDRTLLSKRQQHALRAFISYAHEDEELRDKFVRALSQLQRDGLIEGWDDRGIAAGADWAGVIDERLRTAELIVLLVSNDFLASDYCNEIELATALERHRTGDARVVPLILRPCDWESSRFGKLQALPRDGKPVIDWKTEDHGFLNAVRGLRLVSVEFQKSRKLDDREQSRQPLPNVERRRWPIIAGLAALTFLLFVGGGWSWQRHRRSERVAMYLARGDALFDQRNWRGAEEAYGRARKADPTAPEAYSRLGILYDLEHYPEGALRMYESAVRLSRSPQYVSNLADQYFKLGQYKRAVDEYATIAMFPLAALESAKINRLRNKLDDAEEQERTALRWLRDPSIVNLPENKLPWYFAEQKSIWIVTPNEKLCYAQFELSVTLYLKGNDADARAHSQAGRQSCGDRLRDIEAELKPELERLTNERPEVSERSQAYLQKVLGS